MKKITSLFILAGGVFLFSVYVLFGAPGLLTRVLVQAQVAHTDIITSIVGGGNGDGCPVKSAAEIMAQGMTIDRSGNLMIREGSLNPRLRIVSPIVGNALSPESIISTPSGQEEIFRNPFYISNAGGVAFDAEGRWYVSDGYARIWRRSPAGQWEVFAGMTSPGYSGDGGIPTNAELSSPASLTFDTSGTLYIVEVGSNRIRRIKNGIIDTLLQFDVADARRLAMDSDGNLLVVNQIAHAIRKIDVQTGEVTLVAGTGVQGFSGDGGPATAAQLYLPSDLAVSSNGDIYIADAVNHRVRKIAKTTGIITTVVGTGDSRGAVRENIPATTASLDSPISLAIDSRDRLYIGEGGGTHKGIRVVENGIISSFSGLTNGEGCFAQNAFLRPYSMLVDESNNLTFIDFDTAKVMRVPARNGVQDGTGVMTRITDFDSLQGSTTFALAKDSAGILYAINGNRILKLLSPNNWVVVAGTGVAGFSGDGGPATAATLRDPYDLLVASDGTIFFSDQNNNRIRTVSPTGTIDTYVSFPVQPRGIDQDRFGNLFVAIRYGSVYKIAAGTREISVVAGGGLSRGYPDSGEVSATSTFINSNDVVVASDGTLYISSDPQTHRVFRVTPQGMMRTLVGSNLFYSTPTGDGGPAVGASLSEPHRLALDRQGNLFIADYAHRRIRKITMSATTPQPNPVPVLSGLSHSQFNVGQSSYYFYANGSGFVPDSVIRWNGQDRPTVYVSSQQIRIVTQASDMANPGTVAITVYTPPPGGGVSGSQTLTIIDPNAPSSSQPSITSISPNTKVAGGAGFNMILTGSNFSNNSVVKWNNQVRVTIFDSIARQLTAQILDGDIRATGTFPVTVENPSPSGGVSAPLMFTVTDPASPPNETTSWLSSGDQLYTASQVRKVGIGTTAPDFPLTLQAFVGADPLFSRVFSFQDQNGVRKWHLNFLNGGLNFVQSGVADYRLFLAQNGNVGVGLATPQAKLDVNGTVKVGSLTADPTGENGMIYYNTTMNKFRCYKSSQWRNCIAVVMP